jgi:hypothetical protein
MSIVIVFLALAVSFLLHAMCHRFFGIRSMKLGGVYIAGGVFLIIVLRIFENQFFFPAVVLYTLVSFYSMFLYFGVLLGGETPSSMILRTLQKKKYMKEHEVYALFSKQFLVQKRIEDLRVSGLIHIKDGRYVMSKKGTYVYRCMMLYRRMFHRGAGG